MTRPAFKLTVEPTGNSAPEPTWMVCGYQYNEHGTIFEAEAVVLDVFDTSEEAELHRVLLLTTYPTFMD